jgi:hypothetical protein
LKVEQDSTTNKKSKPAKAISRLEIIDTESGEVLDDGRMIYVPQRMRIKGFFMANQVGFEMLAKSNLTCEGYRVLMLMMSRMEYENAITISQKEIAEALNMKKQNVSRAIKSLRSQGVFEGSSNSAIHLATELGWKGKVRNLHKRNSKLFKESCEKTEPNDPHWKKMDERIEALRKSSKAAATP